MLKVKTEDLIQTLASNAVPVRRLRSPFLRTAVWLAVSVPWIAAVVFVMGLRPDIGERLADRGWLLEESAALATAITAAMAAFCAGVPGRPRWEHFMPLLPLAVWLGVLGGDCVQTWFSVGGAGLVLRPDWQCVPAVVIASLGPGVAMTVMILRGSPIAPTLTTALGALAAGGLAEFGLRLFHTEDASLMVLVWQAGAVFGLVLLAGLLGRKILRWRQAVSA